MEIDPDSQLMMKVAQGDRAAFSRLFERHYVRVTRFALRYVQERSRAEELAQDVFLKLYASAARYQPSSAFKTFLFRIAANHCLNEVRRPDFGWFRRALRPFGAAPEEEGSAEGVDTAHAPDETVAAAELGALAQQALAAMKPRERTAFILCRFEGMSYREAAESLETSEVAVKSLMHRASGTMSRFLAPYLNSEDVGPREVRSES